MKQKEISRLIGVIVVMGTAFAGIVYRLCKSNQKDTRYMMNMMDDELNNVWCLGISTANSSIRILRDRVKKIENQISNLINHDTQADETPMGTDDEGETKAKKISKRIFKSENDSYIHIDFEFDVLMGNMEFMDWLAKYGYDTTNAAITTLDNKVWHYILRK